MNDFVTTGDIAEKLKVDRDRVSYAVRKLKIEPIGRAGIANLYSFDIVPKIRKFLNAVKQKG